MCGGLLIQQLLPFTGTFLLFPVFSSFLPLDYGDIHGYLVLRAQAIMLTFLHSCHSKIGRLTATSASFCTHFRVCAISASMTPVGYMTQQVISLMFCSASAGYIGERRLRGPNTSY